MRGIFIPGMETIINVVVALGGIGVVIGAVAATFAPQGGGLRVGLSALTGAAMALILSAGSIHLVLGIHANTRRTVEAVERLLSR